MVGGDIFEQHRASVVGWLDGDYPSARADPSRRINRVEADVGTDIDNQRTGAHRLVDQPMDPAVPGDHRQPDPSRSRHTHPRTGDVCLLAESSLHQRHGVAVRPGRSTADVT